jgi:hypothetical protein
MKKIIVSLLFASFSAFAFAQSHTEEVDLLQAAYGIEKKEIVKQFVTPSAETADAFWALYDEYEVARKANGKKRIELLNLYAKEYNTLTDEQADEWTLDVIKLATATDKLIVTYYGKIKKVNGAKVATQFYQVENYILTAVRMELMEAIPFVGEPVEIETAD